MTEAEERQRDQDELNLAATVEAMKMSRQLREAWKAAGEAIEREDLYRHSPPQGAD